MFTFPNKKILTIAFLLAIILGVGVAFNFLGVVFAILALLVVFSVFFYPNSSLIWFSFLFPYLPAMNLSIGFDLYLGRVLIPLLFLGWVFYSLIKRSFKVPLGFISVFLFLFLFWIIGSYFYSPILERTLRKLLVFFSIFPLFFVSYGIFRSWGKKNILSVFGSIGVGSSFIILIGLIQFLAQFLIGSQAIISFYYKNIAPFFWGKTVALTVERNPSWFFDAGFGDLLRAFAIFPDPHILSYFLAFAVPLLVCFAFLREDKKRFFYLAVALLGIIVEFLTFSRGGYLGFFSALAFVLLILFLKSSKKKILLALSGIFFAGFLLLLLVFPNNPINQRIASTFDIYEGSNQGRIEIWGEAFNLFKTNPFLGVGLGAYSYEIKPTAGYREPIYAHNLYLEFLAEIGIPGLLFWLGIIFSALWFLVKEYFKNKKSELGIISLALSSSLVWFSVHSFFEMPVYSPIILSLLVFALAFASYLENKENKFSISKS
jgi:O-antigen ligase